MYTVRGSSDAYSVGATDISGGYYTLANVEPLKVNRGFVQSCTSEKCCAVHFTRKWQSKRTGLVSERRYLSYFKDKAIKYKTKLRSGLKDYCPDCGSALFTDRAKQEVKHDKAV